MKVGVGGVASLMWSYLSSKRKISSRSHSVYFLGWSNQGHMATLGQLIAKGIDSSDWLRPIPSHVQAGHSLPPHRRALLAS